MDPNSFGAADAPSGSSRIVPRFPKVAAALVILLAIAVLTGWALDIGPLKTVFPGSTSMKANAAFLFLLSGLSLGLLSYPKTAAFRAILCFLMIAIASLTLIEYVVGRPLLGIDELVFRDHLTPQYPGRMAPVTAASFILVAIALLLHRQKPPYPGISQGITLFAAFGPVFGIVGFLYGVPLLYGSIHYTAMAFHTGLGLLVLMFGVLFADPEEGFVRIFLADTSGGVLARVVIPASFFIPVLLGYIFIHGRFNFGEVKFGSAMTVIACSSVFIGLIWTLSFFLESRELQWTRAKRQANIDSLTGLLNRRYFESRLAEEIRRSERSGAEFSLILFNVDHFKALNDSMGHLAGDQALIGIAEVLKSRLGAPDLVCRIGGEEFCVISFRGQQAAMVVAEELRSAVEKAEFAGLGQVRMTVSAGVATCPAHAADRARLLMSADIAMYTAKTDGRNRVMGFEVQAAGPGVPQEIHSTRR